MNEHLISSVLNYSLLVPTVLTILDFLGQLWTNLDISYWTFWFTISSNSHLLCHSERVGFPDMFSHTYQHFLNFQGFPGLQENKSSLLGKVLLTFQIIA